jgi:ketosteroid isomerase-like protein
MSQNVEIVKRALDAYNRRDVTGFVEWATQDFELVPALLARFEGGSVRGRDGLEAFFGAIPNTWEEFRAVGEDFRDLGDRVLVLGRAHGRGRGSGVQVDAPLGMLFELRGGKIARTRGYLHHGEALRAAGLSE